MRNPLLRSLASRESQEIYEENEGGGGRWRRQLERTGMRRRRRKPLWVSLIYRGGA